LWGKLSSPGGAWGGVPAAAPRPCASPEGLGAQAEPTLNPLI
jgi:hypothetical protein